MKRDLKILGSGIYLPRKVDADELDVMLGLKKGKCYATSHVRNRHWVNGETATEMGMYASLDALKDAGIKPNDLELIVSTSGVTEQTIPNNASLIQEKLKLQGTGIPCLDINSTCMSFVSGLDIVSYLIHNGVYKNALIVSTDIASVGLNRNHLESFANFGDGACSFVVGKSDGNSCIESSHSETYSEGAHDTELIGGGSLIHPREYATRGEEPFLFKMDGRRTFRLSCEKIEPFLKRACCKEGKSFKQCVDECKVLVPHQASYRALSIVRARLGIPEDKMVNIVENYGNMISVSVPLGLHTAMKDGTLQRGEKYILVGFGAGLHLGFLKGVY